MERMWRKLFGRPYPQNDIHSSLNRSHATRVHAPGSVVEASRTVRHIAKTQRHTAICGGRHSMGGQQFLNDGELIDTRRLRTVSLDSEKGIARIGAGALWPRLQAELERLQPDDETRWTFRQKQTGGDRLSIGGSLASNIHSRGLTMRPFVDDIDGFSLIGPDGSNGEVRRDVNADLWPLVIGGYGLFGMVTEVDLRLVRRHQLRRHVEIRTCEGLMAAFSERIAEGFEFGDFQFAIDASTDDFLHRGVFACYKPLDRIQTVSTGQINVPQRAWHHLVYLAHSDKAEAFRLYADFYRRTDGQIYWSDSHQMTPYLDDYHAKLDRRVGAVSKGSEMITELYVPRTKFEAFMDAARDELRRQEGNVIYGTVRLIEAENETVLAWATQAWACIIFNLHVDHDEVGIKRAESQFRALIDIAQSFGGSFYLTYHRWASRDQILLSNPRMPEFLAKKREFDPNSVFDSDWHRHISSMFS